MVRFNVAQLRRIDNPQKTALHSNLFEWFVGIFAVRWNYRANVEQLKLFV
jgi:hypothetical protein